MLHPTLRMLAPFFVAALSVVACSGSVVHEPAPGPDGITPVVKGTPGKDSPTQTGNNDPQSASACEGEGYECQDRPSCDPEFAPVSSRSCANGATCCARGAKQPVKCCAPDPTQSGCMNLGGAAINGACLQTCDFFCSTNWRLEKDTYGCLAWNYDHRAPTPDETDMCFPKPDAGPIVDAAAH